MFGLLRDCLIKHQEYYDAIQKAIILALHATHAIVQPDRSLLQNSRELENISTTRLLLQLITRTCPESRNLIWPNLVQSGSPSATATLNDVGISTSWHIAVRYWGAQCSTRRMGLWRIRW